MNIDKSKILKGIALIVAIVGILVIIGWIFNLEFLRNVIPNAISMRFVTAICFVLSSIVLYSIVKIREKDFQSSSFILFSLIASSMSIVFLMIISLSVYLNINYNFESIFSYVDTALTYSGVPIASLSTIFCFLLISWVGIFTIFTYSRLLVSVSGIIIFSIASCVLLGYMLNIPLMYFSISGISNPMAIHTSILFLLMGVAFLVYALKSKLPDKTKINPFFQRYTINQKLLLNSFIIIYLLIFICFFTYVVNLNMTHDSYQLSEVEHPLETMVEQVISYDASLTGTVHAMLLHAYSKNFEGFKEQKSSYDSIGLKLDTLLNVDAKNLILLSERSKEQRLLSFEYINKLNELNLKLVDLETRAFSAIENKDLALASSLTVSDEYDSYKKEYADTAYLWYNLENQISLKYSTKILQNSRNLFIVNVIFALITILISIVTTIFIRNSIVTPIKDLEEVASEISAGNLSVKIKKSSLETKGVIGDVSKAFSSLIENSHLALSTLVKNKINKGV